MVSFQNSATVPLQVVGVSTSPVYEVYIYYQLHCVVKRNRVTFAIVIAGYSPQPATTQPTYGRFAHPFLGNITATVEILPDDPDGQVSATIARMRDYILQDAQSPAIRNLSMQLARNARGSETRYIGCVWELVSKLIVFRSDEKTAADAGVDFGGDVVEVLIRPVDIIAADYKVGDCDDFTMLAACLLVCAGVKVQAVTIAAEADAPNTFSHVYLAAYPKVGGRTPLDCSHGKRAGWESPRIYRIQEWEIN